jgi:hypothetical protein
MPVPGNTKTAAAPGPEDSLRKKLSVVGTAVQVVSTLAVTTLLSFFGAAGTVAGLAVGTTLSAVVPTVLEHVTRHSGAAAKAQYEKYRARGLSPARAKAAVAAQSAAASQARRRFRRKAQLLGGLAAVVVFGVSVLVLTGIEGATGKPLSNLVQNKAGHGTTFTGSSGGSAPEAPAVTPPGSSSAAPVRSSSHSPASTPGTSSASVTPTAPASTVPAASPSAAPTAAAATPAAATPAASTPASSAQPQLTPVSSGT